MKRIRLFLYLILLFAPITGASQVIEGQVLHDMEGQSGVHVINRSRNRATITDHKGRFMIPVRVGDTLFISSLNLEHKTILVNKELYEGRSLILALKEQVVALDEVVVKPFNLSGNLETDMEEYIEGKVATASTLGLPNAFAKSYSQSERLLIEATSGSGFIPLNPILNGISGRTRMLKERVKRDQTYERTQQLRQQLGDSLLSRNLRIPVSRIADFMYFCEVDENFQQYAIQGDLIRLLEFMEKKSKTYRALNGI